MTHTIQSPTIRPRVNIAESDEVFTIEAELPGVAKSDLEVRVKDGELTVTGKRLATAHNGTYRIRERPARTYYRAFTLGDAIDTEGISAELNEGVLTLTLRKQEKARPVAISVN